ncbi:MAG TPA: IS66 family insertion sequence element accessory protein TnpB [Polyangiales bacterium]|nr:IS66 family insertion sequence element accessory protein TnpB [Polyangiales bacterium]
MIGLPRALNVYAYTEPVDMRKSFNTLSAVVEEQMKRSVLAGDFFLFVSADRKRAKVLYFDGTGLCLLAKRLERGKFAPVWNRKKAGGAEMTPSELALFIEGSETVGRLPMSPPLLEQRDLRSKMPSEPLEPC